MPWTTNRARIFVRNLGQAMLILTGYGLLVSFVQNLLVFFASPLFKLMRLEDFGKIVAKISGPLQWYLLGFLALLLIGLLIAFFFRRLKKWAWYGMNGFMGIVVMTFTSGTAFLYEMENLVSKDAFVLNIEVFKAIISIVSFTIILVGLALIRNLNRQPVKALFFK